MLKQINSFWLPELVVFEKSLEYLSTKAENLGNSGFRKLPYYKNLLVDYF